jgi:hypothetical protein
MPLQFVTAEQRIATRHPVNALILGPSKVGKTSLVRQLDPASTLFCDGEAGDLAAGTWPGTMIKIRDEAQRIGMHPWELCRALACIMSGPDPAASTDATRPSHYYGAHWHSQYCQYLGNAEVFAPFNKIFFDSITVASRWSFSWSQGSPDAKTKSGAYDGLGAYGRHGQEMITWLTNMQHIPGKSIIMVGILDEDLDQFKMPIFTPQIEGSKTSKEIAGIFDEVITLGLFKQENGQIAFDMKKGDQRAFICGKNPWGVPAGDRSGTLSLLEPPDLAALINKIQAGQRQDGTLNINAPTATAAV